MIMWQHKQPHNAPENLSTQIVGGERGGTLPVDLSTFEISCVFAVNDTGNMTESAHRENFKK